MSRPVPTPMLDRAERQELTSGEIIAALRELTAIDPNKRDYGIRIRPYAASTVSCRIVVGVDVSHDMHTTIEAALISERQTLLEIVEEIEAGA